MNLRSAENLKKRYAYQMVDKEVGIQDQKKRFMETARELMANESPDALDRIMGKLDLKKKPEPSRAPKPDK